MAPERFFDPTPDERVALEAIAAEIPGIQDALTHQHPDLTGADRGAHQQQLAASRVTLTMAPALPPELDGLGLFVPGQQHIGIARVSTGLGCPHAETEADFLGLMAAFRTRSGQRVDFIAINDPTSPTDTPEEFIALLKATADAAGSSGQLSSQARLLFGLARHAGHRAPAIALHVTGQTLRTVRSSSAYQQYWTGIVRARHTLGKFTFAPVAPVDQGHALNRGPRHLTEDWRRRQQAGPLAFRLEWIPHVDEDRTSTTDLTRAWDAQPVTVGTLVFPAIDPESLDYTLVTLLAAELGANPGHWLEGADDERALPSTRFTAARQLAYAASQRHRNALNEASYAEFFEHGAIDAALAQELVRRYKTKRAARHWTPDVGAIED